jgi:P-type E1-E2 ATPase
MIFEIPFAEKLEINTIVMDFNGTLAVKSIVSDSTKLKLKKLKELGYRLFVFTGNQRGTAEPLIKELGLDCKLTPTSKDKEREFLKLNPKTAAAIGNSRIDIGMFKHAKLSIVTLQGEGIHSDTLKHAEIIVPSIEDALELFIDKDSLISILRA